MYKWIGVVWAVVFCSCTAGAWGVLPYCITRGADGTTTWQACFGELLTTAGSAPCLNLTIEDTKERSSKDAAAVRQELHKYVQTVFSSWINTVRGTIKSSGREAEFADFFKSFPSAIEVHLLDATRPVSVNNKCSNISVTVGKEGGYEQHVCASAEAPFHHINWYTYRYGSATKDNGNDCHGNEAKVLAHEVGHLFGLADLYWNKLDKTAEEHKMVQDFSLLRMGISSAQMLPYSVMGTATATPIGCDDVDGIINMVDLALVKQGKVSPRIKNGWKSFCPSYTSFSYAYGQPYRSAEEYAQNKKRIDAISFFEQSYQSWDKEYSRLDNEIKRLEEHLAKAPRPLTTADLMDSAKINYLKERRNQVGDISSSLGLRMGNKQSILSQYDQWKAKLDKHAGIAPGTPLYDQKVLAGYKPSADHVEESVPKREHICVKCGKPIKEGDEGYAAGVYFHLGCKTGGQIKVKPSVMKAYIAKYQYDKKPPLLTYSQLSGKAVAQGLRLDTSVTRAPAPSSLPSVPEDSTTVASVRTPASGSGTKSAPAGKKSSAPTFKKPTAPLQKAKTPAADQFSEKALAGRPRAKVQPLPQVEPKPKASAPAKKPVELVCAICGKKIENEADAYIPPEKSRGPVHKHSECAYKYFSRFYAVDNTSLDKYTAFYFLNEPAGVTAAKGMMKKLGLTPKEVKEYAGATREAAQEAAQKRREAAERAKKGNALKAAYNQACSGVYVKVSQADKEKFLYDNRVALNSIRKKQKENKRLTKKEQLVWQNYQNMLANEEKQKKCKKAAADWKAFNRK